MGSKRARKPGNFMRYIRVPFRVLARARDLYIQSLSGGGANMSYGNAMGCPITPQTATLPRSFSAANSSESTFKAAEDELRELMRLASTRNPAGAELRRSKSTIPLGGGAGGGGAVVSMPRSNTVPFGRIDEERASEMGEEDDVGLLGESYTRSRSYAVSRHVKVA